MSDNNLNKKHHGLGKGISSLMDDYSFDAVFESALGVVPVKDAAAEKTSEVIVQEVELSHIRPNPRQPRKTFEEEPLRELAESIKNQGVLQPILVEKIAEGEYSIIAGERRYRASKMAGLEKVPVIVKDFTDLQRLEVSLIENIQRENLNPIEEAKAYSYLLQEAGIKQDELAQRVGKNRSTISNSIRLLQLPESMQDALLKGKFTAGHARAILSVVNPADQEILYRRMMEQDLSVRAAEQLASDLNRGKRAALPKKKGSGVNEVVPMKSADMLALEEKFLEACGTRVEIKGNMDRGRIEITYHSLDDLQRLYQLLAPGHDLYEFE